MQPQRARRRKIYVLVFIFILLAGLWLLLQPRTSAAQFAQAATSSLDGYSRAAW
ncbi:MAG: hypothetical protein LC797_07610 [Chloroflexi bacterium]|nr:hypothetical protein [Chloroflexota bacterium]